MSRLVPSPLQSLRVTSRQIPAHGHTPNTSIQKKPLLIYHAVFPEAGASAIEQHLKSIGAVQPQWRYTMYSTSHFHSTTHEVLCVCAGRAVLCFGHEENKDKLEKEVQSGDVIVVPAGVAHRLIEDLDGGFQMVGCYPPGKQWDMCYGKKDEEEKIKGIKDLGWFSKDPIYGGKGPALEH